ncbi:MAG: preprotein translocase subunit Sec61beta [Desulfurococcales archaeon]|nr:preprotein translocase subunit Sec61beta [Desulfurococcales archaeon]
MAKKSKGKKGKGKSKKPSGPMTAAGLISFYEEYEGQVKMSPAALIAVSIIFTAIVMIARALF